MNVGPDYLDVARKAFLRVVTIDPEDGKAWGNLSATLIKLGRAKEAYKATIEALKTEPR